jgi:hypothetical protein
MESSSSREYAALAARQRELLTVMTAVYYATVVMLVTSAGVLLTAHESIPSWQAVALLLSIVAHAAALMIRDVIAGIRDEDSAWRVHVVQDLLFGRVAALSWRLSSDDAWSEESLSLVPGGAGAVSFQAAIEDAGVYSALPAVSLLAYSVTSASASPSLSALPFVVLSIALLATFTLATLGAVSRLERSLASTPHLRQSIAAGNSVVPAAIALDIAANAASLALSVSWLGPVAAVLRVAAAGVASVTLTAAAHVAPAAARGAWMNMFLLHGLLAQPGSLTGETGQTLPWPAETSRARARRVLFLLAAGVGVLPCVIVTAPGIQAAIAGAIAQSGSGPASSLLGICSVDAAASSPAGVCSGGGALVALAFVVALWALRLAAFVALEIYYGVPASVSFGDEAASDDAAAADDENAVRRAAHAAFTTACKPGAGKAQVAALSRAAARLGSAICNDADAHGNTLLHSLCCESVVASGSAPVVVAALSAVLDVCGGGPGGSSIPPRNDAHETVLHAALRACIGVAANSNARAPEEVGCDGTTSADVVTLLAIRLPRCAAMRDAQGCYPLHCAVRCWRALGPRVFEVLSNAYPPAAEVMDPVRKMLPLSVAIAEVAPVEHISALLDAWPSAARVPAKVGAMSLLPLHHALQVGADPAVIRALGAVHPDAAGQAMTVLMPSLHWALATRQCAEIVRVLTVGSLSADIDVGEGTKMSPLSYALYHRSAGDVVGAVIRAAPASLSGDARAVICRGRAPATVVSPLEAAILQWAPTQALINMMEADPAGVSVLVDTRRDLLRMLLISCDASVGATLLRLAPMAARLELRDGQRMLHVVLSERKDPALVHAVLQAAPEQVYVRQSDGQAPLHLCTRLGSHAAVTLAVLAVDMATALERWSDLLPIHLAASAAGTDPWVIAALMAATPRAGSTPGGRERRLPLHWAAGATGLPEDTFSAILEANPRAAQIRDGAGEFPLHRACTNSALTRRTLAALLGANSHAVHTRDDRGVLPHDASIKYQVARKLRDMLERAMTGPLPPLHEALQKRASQDVLAALIHADPGGAQLRDSFGRTALEYAVTRAERDVTLPCISYLIDAYREVRVRVLCQPLVRADLTMCNS